MWSGDHFGRSDRPFIHKMLFLTWAMYQKITVIILDIPKIAINSEMKKNHTNGPKAGKAD